MLAVTAVADPQTADVTNLLARVIDAVEPASMLRFGERVADYIERRAVQRFAGEGDAASGDWEALAPTTQRIRASLGYGASGPINIRTEELFQWVTYSADISPFPGGVQVTSPNLEAMPGSAVEKLITAQRGRDDNPLFPGAHTPPRPVVAMDETDMKGIMSLLQLHIMESVIGSFAGTITEVSL